MIGTTIGAFYANYKYNFGQWYHGAVVMIPWDENCAQCITVYINGQMVNMDTNGLTRRSYGSVPGNLVIGRRGVDWDAFYSSVIMDEITIFDTAIPAADITKIYEMSAPSP